MHGAGAAGGPAVIVSTRVQFGAAAVLTVAAIALLAGYGWRALELASREAEEVGEDLTQLARIARLEGEMRDRAAGSGLPTQEERERIDRLLESLRRSDLSKEEAHLVELTTDAVRVAVLYGTPQLWNSAGDLVGELEETRIRHTRASVGEGPNPNASHRRARQLLQLGAAVVVFFGVVAGLVYRRLRRERQEAHARLRRSERLAALGTVAASVAHEINNPLATISGCATAVRDRLRKASGDHADSLEYLEMIREETRRCSGIVKTLRDLAREGPPAMAPADLPAVARDVLSLLAVDGRSRGVEMSYEGVDHLEAICDPDKVKQLLLNLLVNAREACGEAGHVVVSVHAVDEDRARIEVRDDGKGIEPRDLQRIFEPFHTDKTTGLGIGLFLCERIAALHGGSIVAESGGAGKGARLSVTLPTRVRAGGLAAVPRAVASQQV